MLSIQRAESQHLNLAALQLLAVTTIHTFFTYLLDDFFISVISASLLKLARIYRYPLSGGGICKYSKFILQTKGKARRMSTLGVTR